MDRASLLRELTSTPSRLAEAARRAPPPPPGEWSAREVVCHLVAVEAEVWHRRLDTLWEAGAHGPEPRWPWVEPGPWAGPGSDTLDGALEAFAIRRAATLDRLARLDDAGWQRAGIHATYGRIDVERLAEIAIDHDREHLTGLT